MPSMACHHTLLQYQYETSSQLTREIADEIKNTLKELDLDRYKFVVQARLSHDVVCAVCAVCACSVTLPPF